MVPFLLEASGINREATKYPSELQDDATCQNSKILETDLLSVPRGSLGSRECTAGGISSRGLAFPTPTRASLLLTFPME